PAERRSHRLGGPGCAAAQRRAHGARGHARLARQQGLGALTDAAITALNELENRVVFVLWGGYARKKAALVTNPQHVVLEAGHPSPMNPKGFLGSRPFSAIDKALADAGRTPIHWS